jgi:K+-transporting ATPase ATPase C chain
MIRETVRAFGACLVSFVVCAFVYPVIVWGIGKFAFPAKAEGSLVYSRDRTVIGSELVAQPFTTDRYFHPRPSAVDYKADAAGGSNLGTNNPALRDQVKQRTDALKATPDRPAPVELVTASGSGLDPHLSPEGAHYQAARVAAARNRPVDEIDRLIDFHVEHSGALFGGPERVNVLRLNLALDDMPEPGPRSR